MKRLLLGSLLSCMVASQVSCGIWDSVVKPVAEGAKIALCTATVAGVTSMTLTRCWNMVFYGSFLASAAVALGSLGTTSKSAVEWYYADSQQSKNEAKKNLFTSLGALATSGLMVCIPMFTESRHIHTSFF